MKDALMGLGGASVCRHHVPNVTTRRDNINGVRVAGTRVVFIDTRCIMDSPSVVLSRMLASRGPGARALTSQSVYSRTGTRRIVVHRKNASCNKGCCVGVPSCEQHPLLNRQQQYRYRYEI